MIQFKNVPRSFLSGHGPTPEAHAGPRGDTGPPAFESIDYNTTMPTSSSVSVYRTISGVGLRWELEEHKGPK